MNYEIGDLVRNTVTGDVGIVVSIKLPHVNKGVQVHWSQAGERRNYYKGQQYQLEKVCK